MSLTGGTNDVNPQPLRCRITPSTFTTALIPSNAASTVTVALPIPVQRLGTGGRAQVMEILKVDWDCAIFSGAAANPLAQAVGVICLSSRSNGTSLPVMGSADPYTICFIYADTIPGPNPTTAAAGRVTTYASGQRDLTDGAGHGVLFGMDTLYVQFTAIAGTAVATQANSGGAANVIIWYRWKNVGFTEYVGMVTSS